MTTDEAMQLLGAMKKVGPLPGEEPEMHPLVLHCLEALAELKRFREREPLVQALLRKLTREQSVDSAWRRAEIEAADAVRDFKMGGE